MLLLAKAHGRKKVLDQLQFCGGPVLRPPQGIFCALPVAFYREMQRRIFAVGNHHLCHL